MADQLTNYDPSQVTFAFANFDITGYNDGTFIEVELEEDGFTKHVGSLGEVTRVRNLNFSGKITLTLRQAASSNDILNALYQSDRLTARTVGTINIQDHNGNMLVHSESAWIMKAPKIERAKGVMPMVWVFEAVNLEMQAGGNTI